MDGEGRWICVRQRAGPLVKEQRAIRPRLSQYDSPYERAEKNRILRTPGYVGRAWTAWSYCWRSSALMGGATR
jgi:hypothetical protein